MLTQFKSADVLMNDALSSLTASLDKMKAAEDQIATQMAADQAKIEALQAKTAAGEAAKTRLARVRERFSSLME